MKQFIKTDNKKNTINMAQTEKQKAVELLQKQNQEDLANCQREVEEVFKKYECNFDVSFILKANQVIPQIQIIKSNKSE